MKPFCNELGEASSDTVKALHEQSNPEVIAFHCTRPLYGTSGRFEGAEANATGSLAQMEQDVRPQAKVEGSSYFGSACRNIHRELVTTLIESWSQLQAGHDQRRHGHSLSGAHQ